MSKAAKPKRHRPKSGWRGRGPEPAWFEGWIARKRAEGQRIAERLDSRAAAARRVRANKAIVVPKLETP